MTSSTSRREQGKGLPTRMRWALLLVLGLTGYAALQPDPADEMLVERTTRGTASASRPAEAAATASQGRANTAQRAAPPVAPMPAEHAQRLAAYVQAWQRRPATAASQVDVRRAEARTAVAWASQAPPPPPSPPPAEPMEEPAPVAPRFPYEWVGRYVDDAPRAVIAGPVGTWVIRQGDVLEGIWRLDKITDQQLRVTYLPLNQSQTLAMK